MSSALLVNNKCFPGPPLSKGRCSVSVTTGTFLPDSCSPLVSEADCLANPHCTWNDSIKETIATYTMGAPPGVRIPESASTYGTVGQMCDPPFTDMCLWDKTRNVCVSGTDRADSPCHQLGTESKCSGATGLSNQPYCYTIFESQEECEKIAPPYCSGMVQRNGKFGPQDAGELRHNSCMGAKNYLFWDRDGGEKDDDQDGRPLGEWWYHCSANGVPDPTATPTCSIEVCQKGKNYFPRDEKGIVCEQASGLIGDVPPVAFAMPGYCQHQNTAPPEQRRERCLSGKPGCQWQDCHCSGPTPCKHNANQSCLAKQAMSINNLQCQWKDNKCLSPTGQSVLPCSQYVEKQQCERMTCPSGTTECGCSQLIEPLYCSTLSKVACQNDNDPKARLCFWDVDRCKMDLSAKVGDRPLFQSYNACYFSPYSQEFQDCLIPNYEPRPRPPA